MTYSHLVFRVHSIQRMFERRISDEDVQHVLKTGEVIENYPHESPYPSRLVLGFCGSRPIHIVAADNKKNQETIIITVYEPELSQWDSTFQRRKKS